MESNIKSYNGTENVRVFIEKVSIHSALKGYESEKAAQNIASRLEGRAFDVYLRLSDADRKDVEKVKAELLKEFERGNLDREEAINQLAARKNYEEESPQTFAYKILELVKLAYPSFDETTRNTIAKDYFVKGVHPKMQVALKSLPDFTSADINVLAEETVRLKTAGIQSFVSTNPVKSNDHCMAVNSIDLDSLVDSITDKVVEKMKKHSVNDDGGQDQAQSVNWVASGNSYNQRFPRANNYRYSSSRGRNPRGRYQRFPRPGGTQERKCRSCQSPNHFVKDCPTRFCQACGNTGHDSWSQNCPKYQ